MRRTVWAFFTICIDCVGKQTFFKTCLVSALLPHRQFSSMAFRSMKDCYAQCWKQESALARQGRKSSKWGLLQESFLES